jgi:VIT1/CCC1 family predicted Fe2+/Mn2+ transporter
VSPNPAPHPHEHHTTKGIGWLRAAVLGANDGIISTASLVVGVAAAGSEQAVIVMTGVAGRVAGAMSMAAGEYVSVQSQADAERADLAIEKKALKEDPERELAELTAIYISRGVEKELARRVARQLTKKDALEAHARDELGITETLRARPVQAAIASALSFAAGAAVPIVTAALAPPRWVGEVVAIACLVTLLALGALAAHVGGASMARGAARIGFWGAIAMGLTALVGRLFAIDL